MKLLLQIILLISTSTSVWTQNEVKIGNQIWMNKNLDIVTFRNGDKIPEAKTEKEWRNARDKKQPAWCYYVDDTPGFFKDVLKQGKIDPNLNQKGWGKLYNLYAVIDKRGLAPIGWRIPTKEDFVVLITTLGGKINAGEKLRARNIWGKAVQASNSSGFNAVPSGYRASVIFGFMGGGTDARYWTSTLVKSGEYMNSNDRPDAESVLLNYGLNEIFEDNIEYYSCPAGSGLSVRCIKD